MVPRMLRAISVSVAVLSLIGCFSSPHALGQTRMKGAFEYSQGGTLQPTAPPMVELKKDATEVIEQVNVVDHMIGFIDWENKVVHAVGEGVPPKDAISPAQASVRAKRAATDVAYAALLEAVQAVRVDSESTTRNFVNENHVVRTKVEGFVKNAEIEKLKQFEDGRFQIMMKMPLVGHGSLAAATYLAQRSNVVQIRTVYEISQPTAPGQLVPLKPDAERETPKAPAPPGQEQSKAEQLFTGLIVDTKGLNAKPALYPRILTEGGRTVYDIAIPNPNAATEEGMVEYRKSLEDVKKRDRVGTSPLIVKAKQIGGKYGADIVLGEEDARRVLEADSRGKFLGDAKVVVVID